MRTILIMLALAVTSAAAFAGDTTPAATGTTTVTTATSTAAASSATAVTGQSTVESQAADDTMSYGFGGCSHARQSHAEALLN